MKSTVLRMTLVGALAFGGMTLGAGVANAACIVFGGAYVCGPIVKHKQYRRHRPAVVLEFGRPHRYYVKKHIRRKVYRDPYYDGYHQPYYGSHSPHWHGWGPSNRWR